MNLALILRLFPDPTISLIGALKWYLFQVNKTTNPGFSIKLVFFSTATACTGTPLPGEPPSWGWSGRPLSHPRLQWLRITRHSKLCKTLMEGVIPVYKKLWWEILYILEGFGIGLLRHIKNDFFSLFHNEVKSVLNIKESYSMEKNVVKTFQKNCLK